MIAVDTSGSIPDADLAVFLSEVQSICTTVKPDKVRLLYWGHEVVGDESYESHEIDTLAKSTRPKVAAVPLLSAWSRYAGTSDQAASSDHTDRRASVHGVHGTAQPCGV